MTTPTIDPIKLEVMWNRLNSIALEQTKALIRTGFTTILRDAEDVAVAIFDDTGRMIAQSVLGTAGHINSIATGMKHFLTKFKREDIYDGDILITNDPWIVSGHKHDITIVAPIFYQRRLVGFTASTCHVLDVGGRILSAEANEVYEEGLEIPIMKLYERGEENEALFEIIENNIRQPKEVVGDILAQVAATRVAREKMADFFDDFKLTHLRDLGDLILETSERKMRRAIAEAPDGVYDFEMYLDGFDFPLRYFVTVTIKGDEVWVDYTGSSPQSSKGINVVFNYTHAYTTFGINMAFCPDIPMNDGSFRPVHVYAPPGCFLNAQFPAPVAARHLTGHFCATAVWGALAKVLPERVVADSAAVTIILVAGVNDRGDSFLANAFCAGGMGARAMKDGISSVACPANIASTPTEVIEATATLFFKNRELVTDSGGAGKYRGGCGQRINYEVRTSQPAVFSCMWEKVEHPPFGLFGGQPGAATRVGLYRNGKYQPLPPKGRALLQPKDEVEIFQSGGGGFYDPTERDPLAVLQDVLDGLVSIKAARSLYKIVIDPQGRSINEPATQRLRAANAKPAQKPKKTVRKRTSTARPAARRNTPRAAAGKKAAQSSAKTARKAVQPKRRKKTRS